MPYEDVKVKCHYCDARVEGNQRYMVGGRNIAQGRTPRWLLEKPEHQWIWNGLSDWIDERRFSFDFYLCPDHTSQEDFNGAMKWAQNEIDGTRALSKLFV